MPDYMFLLESRLSAEQRAAVVRVQELAAAMGANVYLVGGAVRDLISGMPLRDLDFTVEGNPFRITRELEKGGAKILVQDDRLRHVELIFAGDPDGSISAARDDVYRRPGTKPEVRWSTIMEDLRRRDFSLNAIAISLNAASRGLLLDPTNGLADLEKQEVRALSMHSFTNQPVRLLRAQRYCARLGFKLESRTAEWFALAMERGLHETIPGDDVGDEVRQLAREDKPVAILKLWETRELIGAVHPHLARRHPHYERMQRLMRVRETFTELGLRPRLFAPVTAALLARLKSRERSAAMAHMEFRSAEKEAVVGLEHEAKKLVKLLASRKMAAPRDAFAFLEKTPLQMLVYILAEVKNAKAVGRIRNYLHKWRPLRQALPLAAKELEGLGMPRGPKFDKVVEDLFQLQLLGRGRNPEDRVKVLRKLSGIKEPPKKKIKEEKKKPVKGEKKDKKEKPAEAAAAAAAPAPAAAAPPPPAPAPPAKPGKKEAKAAAAPPHKAAPRKPAPPKAKKKSKAAPKKRAAKPKTKARPKTNNRRR